MTNERKTFEDRLAEEINDDLLNASDEEILGDAEAAGVDTRAFANRMRNWLAPAPKQIDTEAPRKAGAPSEPSKVRRLQNASNVKGAPHFVPDTIAARHGKSQSGRDKAGIEDDLNDLFSDDEWGEQDED